MNVSRAFWAPAFFIAFFAVGVLVFDDFGMGWDEPMHRQQGRRMLEYVTEGNPRGVQHHMRYHGPLVDTSLYFLETKLGLEDPYDVYRMRHFAYFLLFYVGVFFFYRLSARYWGSSLGLVGAVFLVASPRIFADSFYNPKDIPCLSFFVISFYTMVRFLEERTVPRAALHAFATALLLATRTVGLLVPALTVAGLLLVLVGGRELRASFVRAAGVLGVYLGLAAALTVLFWPTLWRDPLLHASRAFLSMSRYQGWPGEVLYFGTTISAEALPWHYLPVWILITTPTSYLVLFAAGCFFLLVGVAARPFDLSPSRVLLLLVAAWLVVPLFAVIVLDSVVYDSWRHAFFVYPALLLLALVGLGELLRRPKWRPWALGVVAVDLAFTLAFLVAYHPHQNAYFNPLLQAAGGAEGRFDIDYWGVSYRAGLERILEEEATGPVRVAVANSPGIYNANLLPREQRERLIFEEDPSDVDFFLTNYRFSREVALSGEETFALRVSGNRVLGIYRAGVDVDSAASSSGSPGLSWAADGAK